MNNGSLINCLQGPPPPAAPKTGMEVSAAAPDLKMPPAMPPVGQQQPKGNFFSTQWFLLNGGPQHHNATCNMTHLVAHDSMMAARDC